MTKLFQIQIQLPISSLFTLHGSCLLPPLMSSIRLMVAAMCCLCNSNPICASSESRATYVTSPAVAFPDLKQTALQVVLQLAQALMKALCSESSSVVNSCSSVTSVFVHSKTPLHAEPQSTSARLLELFTSTLHHFRVGTSCGHSAHFNCLPFNRQSCSRSIVFSPPQSSQGSRANSWWRVLFQHSHRASHRRAKSCSDSLHSRSKAAK